MLDTLGNLKRTNYCGELRASDADTDVVLMGWVHRRRDLGQLIFIDLRDRAGIAQIVFNKELHPEAHAKAEDLRSEFVVAVEGRVIRRQKSNPEIATGEVEVVASRLHILNNAKTPPFQIEDDVTASEETRLRYRYLDLRRPRSAPQHRAAPPRDFRNSQGARRIGLLRNRNADAHALDARRRARLSGAEPHSSRPVLRAAAIAANLQADSDDFRHGPLLSDLQCFRDEDLRADRQPEFTQLDLEMSFPRQEDIFDVIEHVMERACAVVGVAGERPVPPSRLQRCAAPLRLRQA